MKKRRQRRRRGVSVYIARHSSGRQVVMQPTRASSLIGTIDVLAVIEITGHTSCCEGGVEGE